MKKKLFAALLMLAALPVGAQKIKCVVTGVSSENGTKVMLADRNSRALIGTAVVADGKFTITGEADKDALMAVGGEKAAWLTLFFNDGTPQTPSSLLRFLRTSAIPLSLLLSSWNMPSTLVWSVLIVLLQPSQCGLVTLQ